MEDFLTKFGAIGVFLGASFEGQTAVVIGGLLARQHLLPLWLVFGSATAGSGLVDHLLFVAGRQYRLHRHVVRVSAQPAFARALRFIERFPVSYILVFRFIFGLRLASPIAIGVSRVPTWRFALLNLAGAAIWAGAFTAAGYLFGETVIRLFGGHHAGRRTLIVAGVLVLLVVTVALVRRWRARRAR
jgi:membrane protein DedA with SNARE-associated domain